MISTPCLDFNAGSGARGSPSIKRGKISTPGKFQCYQETEPAASDETSMVEKVESESESELSTSRSEPGAGNL